jgi:FAD binding domain
VAPLPGKAPAVLLAERSLPGCLIVDQNGHRFANESADYMSFGQRLLELERSGSRSRRCGSSSTANTATAMSLPQNCFRG